MKTNIFIKKLFFIGLLIIGINFVLSPIAARTLASEKTNIRADVKSGDENFDRIFREGRDLFDKEEWKQAAEKFKQIVCDCPEKKYVDAAFYWLALCYKKQKMYKESNETIERLLKNFPDSSWADDARVMNYEIYALTGKVVATTVGSGQSGNNLAPLASISGTNIAVAGISATSPQTQLDREDEIKLAAFQSLFSADPKKGIEVMGDILRTDSKASETLKREVIRTLRGPRFFRLPNLEGFSQSQTSPNTVNIQLIPILRETLLKGFQNESNIKIRTEIIYSLANINDDQSFNYLSQLYASESNKELKKAIINSFSGGTRFVFFDGFYPGQTYSIGANQNSIKKVYFDKLMEIVRTEKDLELRRLAFSNLQRFSGWSSKEGTVEMLSQMYDAESDELFKISIINSFSGIKNNQAVTKLIDIAKNDKSDKMRLEAIRSLRNNNSPEVIKFLEELIK